MSDPTRIARRMPHRKPRGGKKPYSTPSGAPQPNMAAKASTARESAPPLTEAVPSDTMRFADLGKENLLNPILLNTITKDLKFDHMMPVQAATLHDLLQKRIDILAQAKTGTGKTIAFLLPAIQNLLNKQRAGKTGVSLLVISPTRELAMQIAKEATALLQRLPQYKVSFAIGGTNKDREERGILGGCDILIATPGRLYDHLSNPAIVDAFKNLDTLVLDEADRLLDMGFMKALKDIIACLPDKASSKRQGMLFSATIAPHVQKFAHLVLSEGYKFVSTIPEGEVNTHARVPQLLITVPEFSSVTPVMVSAIRSEIAQVGIKEFKAIVFAPTAALADWYAAILQNLPGFPPVSVLHSRVSQSKRTNVTNIFRDSSSSILVATDVVARGMDFPNVSNVFQVGIPADKESYIHRLGRTARAGREGRGTFIITDHELFFAKYNLKEITFIATPADFGAASEVARAASKIDIQAKVYQAWMGYYKNHLKGMNWTTDKLVAEGNRFAIEGMASGGVPEIQKSTVGKMGLKGVRGLNIVASVPRGGGGNRGGGEGRSAGSGGVGGHGGRGGGRGGRGGF